MTEKEDRKEKATIKVALRMCVSLEWTIRSVAEKMKNKSKEEDGKQKKEGQEKSKGVVV